MSEKMTVSNVSVQRILFATDLSETARHAFSYAASLATLYNASITILHVLQEIPSRLDKHVIGYISANQWEEIKNKHFEEAREQLIGKKREHVVIKEVLDRFWETTTGSAAHQNLKSDDIRVVRGDPVEEILKTVTDMTCDLIVMGTHGHQALTDAVIGSTARRVTRKSPVPVLVVPIRP